MRILQVANFFSPVHGGTAVIPFNVCKELDKRNHRVTLYTTDYKIDLEWVRILRNRNISVHQFRTWLNYAKFQITPGIIRNASKEITTFDITHMHGSRTFQNTAIYPYVKKHHIPYVLQPHGTFWDSDSRKILKRTFDWFYGLEIIRNASMLFVLSQREADEFLSLGINRKRIAIVPNGIDVSEYDILPERGNFRKRHGINDNEKIILYLGRVNKNKGIELLYDAFADIVHKMENIRLVIIGPDDGYSQELECKIVNHNMDGKVLLIKPFYGMDKLEAYVDADVHVLPREFEPFGITILEAAMCGTPSIVSSGCGLADVINGKFGLAIPYKKEDYVDALIFLLNNDEKRRIMAETGKVMVREQFSWPRVVAEIESIYVSCIDEGTCE